MATTTTGPRSARGPRSTKHKDAGSQSPLLPEPKTKEQESFVRLAILLRHLRQAKQLTVQQRKFLFENLPNLPDERELEPLTQATFTEKIEKVFDDGKTLSSGAFQRWEDGIGLPEPLNLLRIAKLARMSMDQLFAYLYPDADVSTPDVFPEKDTSKLLKKIKALKDPNILAEIIMAASQTWKGIMEESVSWSTKSNSKNEEEALGINLSKSQRQKLALLLKKSLETRPNESLPDLMRDHILTANPNTKYSKSSLELVASACCEIKIWDEDGLFLKQDRTYENRLEQLLADLEKSPLLQTV